MTKLASALGLLARFLILVVTLRPNTRGDRRFKVLAPPGFLGGPATKFEQARPLLADRWAPYSTVLCFSAVHTPILLLRILKKLGARIIVNQNGVYYPSWFPRGWKRKNRYLSELNALADHSFFQSEFALASYREWVGAPPARRSVLHNGVDLGRFQPRASVDASTPPRVLVFADVSPLTRLLWEHVLGLQSRVPDARWVFMGRVHDRAVFAGLRLAQAAAETHFDPASARVRETLRSCDVALHLVYNDVCPNKVLECLASGLWVIGLSAGGTAELVGDAGAILSVRHGYEAPDFPSWDSLASELARFRANARACRASALARAARFSLDDWRRALRAQP